MGQTSATCTAPTLAGGEVVVVVEHPHALERVERRVVLIVHLGLRVRLCFFEKVLARERYKNRERHGQRGVKAAIKTKRVPLCGACVNGMRG